MRQKKISIRSQLITAVILILIPITVIFYFFVNRAVDQMNDQIAEANASTLRGYRTSVENEILQIDTFLNILYGENEEFHQISQGEVLDREQTEKLETLLREETALNGAIAFIGIYQNQTLKVKTTGMDWESEEGELANLAAGWMQEYSDRQGWFVVRSDQSSYLVQNFRKGAAGALCAVDINSLSSQAQLEFGLESPIIFVDSQGVPLTSAVWLKQTWGERVPDFENYILVGENYRYMVVQDAFLGMKILYGVRYQDNNAVLNWLRFGPILFFGAMAVLLAVALIYLEYSFFKPLSGLVAAMEKIRDGDLQCRTDHYISREFAQVNDTFNSMIETITNLKIEGYEKELAAQKAEIGAQKAEMTALRMQIHPHFYLNCLKELYGLAQLKAFKEIQDMIILLSKHLRYIFSWNSEMVPLKEELRMCENYVQLQAVGRRDGSRCLLDISPELLEFLVPPVSILTLTENCVKHGARLDHPLEVKVKGKILPCGDGRLADIVISDNGPGFPADILEKLNKGKGPDPERDHVGLWNLIQRFQILYGSRFAVNFWNDRGAYVEIIIEV